MTVFTKPGQQIFAPVDESGNARSVSNQEVQVWSTEVEAGLQAGGSINATAFGATTSVLQTPTQRSTLLQSAIDAAQLLNATCFIPAGTWLIDVALRWKTGAKIIGATAFATILTLASTAAADEAILRPDGYAGTVHDFHIADLVLDGNVAGRGITMVTSTARPGGSNFSQNGAYGGTVERVRSINANLHCFDICGPGELTGAVRDYVMPSLMDQDFTFEPGDGTETGVALSGTNRMDYPSGGYYPAAAGPWTRFIDCEAGNSGDDPFTTHYARYIWIIRCRVTSGSNRHPGAAQGTSIGIEIDDGSRDIWVDGCHIAGCLAGIRVKAHDHNPAGRNIRVTNSTIEQCTVGISASDPYDPSPVSPTANDIIFSNITIRALAPQFGDTDLVAAIECLAYQGVIFDDITIDGNHTYSATYGSCIVLGDAATGIIATNIRVNGWNPGQTDTSLPLIFTTSSCKAYTLRGIKFRNSGGSRGLTLNGTYYTVDDLYFHTPSVIGTSYAVLAAVDPLLSYGFVGHITKENFSHTTRLAGVDSVEGTYAIPHVVQSTGFIGVNMVGGPLSIGSSTLKTIAAGILTLARESVRYSVAGEGGVADDLVTINGTNDGDIIILQAASSTVDIVVKHGTGNVYLNGKVDFTLSHALDKLMLLNHSGSLCEIGRGDNQT